MPVLYVCKQVLQNSVSARKISGPFLSRAKIFTSAHAHVHVHWPVLIGYKGAHNIIYFEYEQRRLNLNLHSSPENWHSQEVALDHGIIKAPSSAILLALPVMRWSMTHSEFDMESFPVSNRTFVGKIGPVSCPDGGVG